MKCNVCGNDSGKYPLCRACNMKKEKGEIIKCETCGKWHYANQPCIESSKQTTNVPYLYDPKRYLISKSERSFFDAIRSSIPEGYMVFPQINLASFIERTDNSRFHNELFRNVDFLITNADFQPIFVIEINDQTHLTNERRERDEKVQKICEEAGIPILKLWTSYGVNPDYIKEKINSIISSVPVQRISHFTQKKPEEPKIDPKIAEGSATQQTSNAAIKNSNTQKKGCYIATCVYGSYDCPSVWILRRFRDNYLSYNLIGRLFIKIYYFTSPTLVKLFGNKKLFRETSKFFLDKLIKKLERKGFENTPYKD